MNKIMINRYLRIVCQIAGMGLLLLGAILSGKFYITLIAMGTEILYICTCLYNLAFLDLIERLDDIVERLIK